MDIYLTIPEFCPYCQTKLIIKKENKSEFLYCPNETCPSRLVNRIDHYLGIKGLNVKGISKATIGKLIDWGWINGLKDLYGLESHKAEWESKPGFGKASVGKILDAINGAGKHTKLEQFIAAIGIPLIGSSIAKQIVKYYSTWSDFRDAVGGDWTEFEGFGPEMSKAINSFDYTEADSIAEMLNFASQGSQPKDTPAAAIFEGKKFCATGKLQSFTRDSLKADIEAHGGKMVGSVTSVTDYLITNTPNSGTAKNASAKKLGIPIITEEQYLSMRAKAD